LARVLIVDDNLLCRALLRQILSDGGHEVVGEAQDGVQAPACVHELRPELVTLDLVMAGRDGLATLKHLPMVDPFLTVVVCSASLDQRNVIDALRLGRAHPTPNARRGDLPPVAFRRREPPSTRSGWTVARCRVPIAVAAEPQREGRGDNRSLLDGDTPATTRIPTSGDAARCALGHYRGAISESVRRSDLRAAAITSWRGSPGGIVRSGIAKVAQSRAVKRAAI